MPTKTKSKSKGATNPLVGKWFHTFYDDKPNEPKKVKNQGCVLGQVSDDVFLVQLYDFVIGAPSTMHLFKLEDMMTWALYVDEDDMRDAYENRQRR